MNKTNQNRGQQQVFPVPEPVLKFIEGQSGEPVSINGNPSFSHVPSAAGIKGFIMEHPLNDVWDPDDYLAELNQNLPDGGYLISSVQTPHQYRETLAAKHSGPAGKWAYAIGSFIKQACAGMGFLRRLYFNPKAGRNWLMSDIEAFGRVFAAGFRIEKTLEANGHIYFMASKTAPPQPDLRGCSSMLLRLPRVGRHGKVIKIYKIRTMYPYSQFLQEYVFENNGLQDGGKIKDDPRITPFGRFLRKSFIDELPNLINLLRGEVKIFGVRAISRHYLSLYPKEFQAYRQQFKPGLIPPEYVRKAISFNDIVEVERAYLEAYEKAPFTTDLKYTFIALYNIFIKRVRSH